jgi:hypothetical protein
MKTKEEAGGRLLEYLHKLRLFERERKKKITEVMSATHTLAEMRSATKELEEKQDALVVEWDTLMMEARELSQQTYSEKKPAKTV